MPSLKINNIAVRNRAYCMERKGDCMELTMYGTIVESRPIDWWTGKPVEGDFITLDGFLADLDTLRDYKQVTIRMNSYGGDAMVSNMIHNRLRELQKDGVAVTCIVDGVAMSGGSLIMCACDHVQVNASSLIMIHKCWSEIYGAYNADELRRLAESNDAYDGAQIAIYHRKTGISQRKLESMMAETTYLTGAEAVELGFADEVLEAEPVRIAASADGRRLYCHGRRLVLPVGVFAPDSVDTVTEREGDPACNKNEPETDPAEQGAEGEKEVSEMTREELMQQHPELYDEIVKEARAAVDIDAAAAAAVKAERERLAGIDAIAGLFEDELVREARYGATACNAQELSYRAAQRASEQGRAFLTELERDAEAGGANAVQAAAAPATEGEEETPATIQAAAKRAMADYLSKKD